MSPLPCSLCNLKLFVTCFHGGGIETWTSETLLLRHASLGSKSKLHACAVRSLTIFGRKMTTLPVNVCSPSFKKPGPRSPMCWLFLGQLLANIRSFWVVSMAALLCSNVKYPKLRSSSWTSVDGFLKSRSLGFEFCSVLSQNERTNSIPLPLISALFCSLWGSKCTSCRAMTGALVTKLNSNFSRVSKFCSYTVMPAPLVSVSWNQYVEDGW